MALLEVERGPGRGLSMLLRGPSLLLLLVELALSELDLRVAIMSPIERRPRRRLLSKLFVFFLISSFDPRLRRTLSHYRIIVVASYSGYRI